MSPSVGSRRTKKLAFSVAAMVLGTVVGIALFEIGSRILLPPPTTYRALSPRTEARFNTRYYPGVKGSSVYKVNSMGVRGREWSAERASEYRILCLGGSTTENIVTDQNRVWTALLEEKLGTRPDGRRVWVGNIGMMGRSSRHHVLQMMHLLDVYDPDLVLVLVGGNDLGRWLGRADAGKEPLGDPGAEEQLAMDRAFAVQPGRFHRNANDPWFKRTRLWALARLLKYQILKTPETLDDEGRNVQRWREMRASGRRLAVLPPMEAALEEYRRNLEQIVDLARARGVELVLITQPSLYREGLTDQEKALLWLGGVGDYRRKPNSLYYEPEALAEGMDAYNGTLRQVCRDRGVQCVDLAKVIPRITEYFYDDVHFTDKAQVLIAETLARALSSPKTDSGLSAVAQSGDGQHKTTSVANTRVRIE